MMEADCTVERELEGRLFVEDKAAADMVRELVTVEGRCSYLMYDSICPCPNKHSDRVREDDWDSMFYPGYVGGSRCNKSDSNERPKNTLV